MRALLRDSGTRAGEGVFVAEGPRLLRSALDRGSTIDAVYLGTGAERAFAPLLQRVRAAGIRVAELREGVLERVGATVTPQPVLAVMPRVTVPVAELGGDGPVLVLVAVQDPGNAGTLLRSAEASGAAGVVFSGNSVDPHNPKVVRSSAGAIFGIAVVEDAEPVRVLEALGAQGRRRLGTAAAGGDPPHSVDLVSPFAIVLGNEAGGVPETLSSHLEAVVTVPIEGGDVESLNVAMAGTVVCFEAARQRRLGAGRP